MKYVITAFSKLSLQREVISAPMDMEKAVEKKISSLPPGTRCI